MTEVKKDHFVVTKILPIEDVKVGDVISTSDYVISNDNKFIQLEFIREEKEDHAIPLRPGIYTAKPTSSGLKLYDTEFTKDAILTSFSTTSEITGKIECFFNNLHIYKEYGYDVPKRAILLYGPAGTGKSSTITQVITQFMGDGKTAVVIWKTDVVEPDDMKHMISHFEYEGVERLFFIAEDLGGVEAEDARMSSKSSLLSLLDNQEKTFKIPVVIIATTNFPEMFLANIANRPQRFDDKIKAGYPNAKERADLMKFLSKDRATEEAIKMIQDKKFAEFTPAHIKDSIIRSAIYSMDHCEVLLGMLEEIDSYNKGYSDKRGMGFGQ